MHDDRPIMIYSTRSPVSCTGENNIKVIWGMLSCSCEWSLHWMLIYLMSLVSTTTEDRIKFRISCTGGSNNIIVLNLSKQRWRWRVSSLGSCSYWALNIANACSSPMLAKLAQFPPRRYSSHTKTAVLHSMVPDHPSSLKLTRRQFELYFLPGGRDF